MKHPFLSISQSVLALTLLSGCSWLGDVSSNMRVDTGLEPQNIDSNVRFRTTYYFRVLTGCRIEKADDSDHQNLSETPFRRRISGHFVPLNDSLYRFRMTGQAAALFNRVHFESGILRKEQIDPFGSSLRYNEQTNAFTPVSADEVRADNARHAAMQDIERFRKLYADLDADKSLRVDHKTQLFTTLIAMIEDRLEQIKASRPQGANGTAPSPGTAGTNPTDTALTKLEKQLSDTEVELRKATTELANTQNRFNEAKKKIAEIETNMNDAKAALATSPPLTDDAKKKIDALTAELITVQQALNTAEINRNAAQELVTQLTDESKAVKTWIKDAHNSLTDAKQDTTKSLATLKEKVEVLLKELGAALTTSPTNHRTTACSGKPSENKYYLLGPEGTKELDPNDRLLLALSVDSKPLISALQQLSDRKFQSGGTNYQVMEDLLQERGQILDSRSNLQKAKNDIGQDTSPNDPSKLKTLLDELRKPYVTITWTTPAK